MSSLGTKNMEAAKRELRHAFKDFDTDKSGYIEPHELAVMMKRLTETSNV